MIVGIDLGTTNSAAAVWQDGKPVLIPNPLGDFLTPSAVAVAEDGSLLIGLAARERMVTDPASAKTLFKRTMGTSARFALGRGRYSSEELSSMVLRGLKADIEAYTGERIDRAVITVPAYFNDKQRKATRRAGELAGFAVERLVNEPTAAALAYGIHELDEESPFLVFDLGGGTFDVSIVEIFDGIIEVRSSAGNNRLGGEDFNTVLANLALQQIGRRDWKPALDPRLQEVLRAASERVRRQLTEQDETMFGFVWQDERYETVIAAAAFEEAAGALIDSLREPVVRALRDGGVRVEELSEIVMVGGATRMPIVRRAVTRMFGRFPSTNVHPDHAVALGAAVQGALQERDAALKEIRLTDVCPFTLGVESAEHLPGGGIRSGLFSPIIERNTVVPASRVEMFQTMRDGQRSVELGIYQGESRFVAENVKLGTVTIPVPPKRAGEISLQCRFSYDSSGLLEVDVTVPETGQARQLVIVDDDEQANGKDVARRRAELARLKLHPRDEAANAAVLERAKRCYEENIGERRTHVAALISGFETALDGQDPRRVSTARDEVVRALDEIEGERIL
ncbi:MAG TPA: molecular chaperone HscC [Allosphingosinicella sp.]|jgi:molecular chaperone HscC